MTEELLFSYGFERHYHDEDNFSYHLRLDNYTTLVIEDNFTFGLQDNFQFDWAVTFDSNEVDEERLKLIIKALTNKDAKRTREKG